VNLLPGSLLFGVAPPILVDCAEQLCALMRKFSRDDFCTALGAPWREAAPVLEEMIRECFVEVVEGGEFVPTKRMRQLALASVSNGLSRPDAEALLRRVIAKAIEVNVDPESFSYGVQRLAVFGSYLSDKAILGDLDLAVELTEWRTKRDVGGGHQSSIREIIDKDASAINKTYAALRLRKPKLISVHAFRELADLGTPYEVVYECCPG
jgi:predicted nucleotidyltransferase